MRIFICLAQICQPKRQKNCLRASEMKTSIFWACIFKHEFAQNPIKFQELKETGKLRRREGRKEKGVGFTLIEYGVYRLPSHVI